MSIDLESDIAALSSAEEFLDYFGVDYSQSFIQTKRIPLLRLYHSVLASRQENLKEASLTFADYKRALKVAYRQLENGHELAFEGKRCEGCTECD